MKSDTRAIRDNAEIIARLSKSPEKGDNAELIELLREDSAIIQARLDDRAAQHQEMKRADRARQIALRDMWGNHASWKYNHGY